MSLTVLTTEAVEQSSYFITVSFTDENEASVVPNAGTIKWTLTDNSGNVMNSRDYEGEDSASTITIELTGNDLAVQAGETAELLCRRLVVQFEYDSDLGSDLPGKAECVFLLRNLTRLPAEIP